MTIVAATRLLNEADIIEAFVRHTAYYVDHHVFVDNGSVDGTLDILRDLIREGFRITVYASSSRSFIESGALTFMYRRAIVDHGADWVIFLDADEFIDDRELGQPLGTYLAAFASTRKDVSCIKVRLRDYLITPDDAPHSLVPCRMTRCQEISNNLKVIVKADLLDRHAVIRPGSHGVDVDDGGECESCLEPNLVHAHYPIRSPYQWLSKSVIGWSKVLASGPDMVRTGHAGHYREPFEVLRTDPRQILRNMAFMETLTAQEGLTHDPIAYRGGALRYTEAIDYEMRAVQVIMQYLHDLATQHGEMLELVGKLGDIVRRDEGEFRRLP